MLKEIIKKRRSIREFKDKKVDRDKFLDLIEAAIWAPTASNMQAWRFVIIDKKEKIDLIKSFSPGLIGTPPGLIIICIDQDLAFTKGGPGGRDVLSIMDTAMAAQNIMLMATDLGLGTCPVGSYNKNAVGKILALPEHISPELIITVGYAAEESKPPARKEINNLIHFNLWEGVRDNE